ncbi:MAG: hypothetical protein HYS38_03275, partial [Acidobacteria bacterium]|nr:hypothetical protein [Acidobacteriota bacterium]
LGSSLVTIRAGTAGGTYYVFAKADADDGQPETNETNNTRSDSTQIGPDLTVSALTVPTTAGAGATITVTDTTKNQGVGTADPSTTRFYLSTNSTLDASDVALADRTVPTLTSGQTNSGSTSVTIPAGTTAGTYYIIAKSDPDNAVAETVETNNTRSASTQVGPDLTVSALTVPTTAGAGATITVTDTTKNQGVGAVDVSTKTRFYLSANGVFDAGDVALGERIVPTLTSGQTNSGSTSVTIPAGTTGGTYYIIAKADADNVVVETQETNNTRSGSTLIGPDLTVTALKVPATAGAGATIAVTDTTKNQGAGTASPSTTRFYLSTNGALDASDVALGGRAVPNLAPGQTSSSSTSVTIPAGTTGGTYYIFAKADADNVVVETQETNNTRSATVKVTAP